MGTAESKSVALKLFESVSTGDIGGVDAILAETATWTIMGHPDRFPLAGALDKQEYLASLRNIPSLFARAWIDLTLNGVTAEGDRVAIEAEGKGIFTDGRPYFQRYHFIFEVEDGKIRRAREYCDTQHAAEMLTSDFLQRTDGMA